MYKVDEKDEVVKLDEVPQSSVGAPTPVLVSDEGKVILAYHLENRPDDWDGTTIRVIRPTSEEPVAIVEFKGCYAHMFGPPNDEAFSGHPLASRGLKPYGAYEVVNSSWIRQLERMNSVHERHEPERFWERRHLIFSFHDSVFECVADGFEIEKDFGSMVGIVPRMVEKLWTR
ncbi:MAG: hypothetical protein QUS14_13985 [Pyrinomonadaceae bacterium]|nr:hypothetical protein [Pyrinomonadaceae bacterium]